MPFANASLRAMKHAGNVDNGKRLFLRQQCNACHTTANGLQPKGPHLVDIGKRYKRNELIESILKPSEKIAQGFGTQTFLTVGGNVVTGFVVNETANDIVLRGIDGKLTQLAKNAIEARKQQKQSMMPDGIVGNLTPEELADLVAYLESLH